MTDAFDWARLSTGAPHELIATAVRLAAAGWVNATLIARIVGARLDAGLDCSAAAVLRDLESPAGARRQLPSPGQAARVGDRLAELGAHVLIAGAPPYPVTLQDAWPELGAPPWIFVRAAAGLPTGRAVAVVGTRQASLDGLRTARDLGRLLGRSGVTVVSGMARGIDQAAHLGALDVDGQTIGVLGTGFDVDYPSGDGGLRADVAASGGLVTELVPAVGPRPRNFPARNRIISGLAEVTVVVEGRARSGAAQTARLAASQGREVLAVPGSINAPTSRAPLDLIRDGAGVLTRLADVLDVLGELPDRVERQDSPQSVGSDPRTAGLDPATRAVLALLGPVPTGVAELVEGAGLPVPSVLTAVGELTARGLVVPTPRGLVRA